MWSHKEIIIFFSDEDMTHVRSPHDESLGVIPKIEGFDMKMTLVDGGEVWGNQIASCKFYMNYLQRKNHEETNINGTYNLSRRD